MKTTTSIRSRKIYLASSWRNPNQPELVLALRAAGHEVYDFRNPSSEQAGFAWSNLDPNWMDWTPAQFIEILATHPEAERGFGFDKRALDWCDTCICALPSGRSAHLELGYAAGQGKDTYVLLDEAKFEPELMYLLNTACANSIEEIIAMMATRNPLDIPRWHQEGGGKLVRSGSHAVRLLREVVELCLAAGASPADICSGVEAELLNQVSKPDYNENGNPEQIAGELADCQILLDIFAHHTGINKQDAVRTKLDILWDRKWEADKHGVVWREGRGPVEG